MFQVVQRSHAWCNDIHLDTPTSFSFPITQPSGKALRKVGLKSGRKPPASDTGQSTSRISILLIRAAYDLDRKTRCR